MGEVPSATIAATPKTCTTPATFRSTQKVPCSRHRLVQYYWSLASNGSTSPGRYVQTSCALIFTSRSSRRNTSGANMCEKDFGLRGVTVQQVLHLQWSPRSLSGRALVCSVVQIPFRHCFCNFDNWESIGYPDSGRETEARETGARRESIRP